MVAAGRVSGLFGAKGEVSLTLFDAFPRDFDTQEPVFVRIDALSVPLFFERLDRRGQRGATALFADIDTEARASELVGLTFSIRESRNADDDSDELCFEDLVGWEAVVDDGLTGRITAFYDNELNPLLEIELGRDGRAGGVVGLIPAVDEFIREIDEKHRKIVLELPEGLLELNT